MQKKKGMKQGGFLEVMGDLFWKVKKSNNVSGVFEDEVFIEISEDDPVYEIFKLLHDDTRNAIMSNNKHLHADGGCLKEFADKWFIKNAEKYGLKTD